MCGIAGIMSGSGAPPDKAALLRMVAMLTHRGPDGHGLYRDHRVALGHTRLAIIDIEGAPQPLQSPDGEVWLSFNGEIFNYIELRRRLRNLGHRFSTNGDGEVIIHAYLRWGSSAWRMLNGQFAFALWDRRRGRLWLVRDRLGILPLYVARRGKDLVFASECKALFAAGVDRRIDGAGLAEIFTCWTAAPPMTPFAEVRQVRPGTSLSFETTLRETESRYWNAAPHATTPSAPEEAVDRLAEHLRSSVALRLRADVPVGAYVSGGLDSAVIADFGRRAVGPSLRTFGIGFADPRYDETGEQRRVVEHLATDHQGIHCDAAAIRDALADVVWHCETPLLRTSPVPLYLLARAVRRAGMKVVMTGEGADELLAGYTIFKEDQIRRFWARRPDSRLRPALLRRIHHYVGDAAARENPLWQAFFRQGLEDIDDPFYAHRVRWRNNAWTLRLLAPEVRATFDLDAVAARYEAAMPADWLDFDPLLRAQLVEIHGFMSSYLLSCQGDRVAMAHGVEARYPFLDPELVDFCLTLPKRHKLLGLRDKLVLRRLAARRLPAEIWSRRKQPFRAPIGQALFGGQAAEAFDGLLSPQALAEDPLLDGAAAARLCSKAVAQGGQMGGEREEMALVGLLTMRLLTRQFGPDFDGRVEEAGRRLGRMRPTVEVDRLTRRETSAAERSRVQRTPYP